VGEGGYWARLEYRVCREFAGMKDRGLRHLWCDGLVPERYLLSGPESLMFRGLSTDRPVLAVVSGANRVDEGRLGELIAEPVAKADADYVHRRAGYVIGGVPPVGHAESLLCLIDEDLLQHDAIWAAAGTPRAVFRLTPVDLLRITGGRVASLKRVR
jgi:prolyl-tRNA editing enzyme YbaK/EbsC (Cys-tRNA(Pro) deacylase)